MKTLPILFAFALLILSCKKREEHPIEPAPKNVRLVEAVSEGETEKMTIAYDQEGKITQLNSQVAYDPDVMHFHYQGKWLWRLENETELVELSRDVQGRITGLYRKWKFLEASKRENLFYDAMGNLAYVTSRDSNAFSPNTDTTFYSGFVGGRFTVATTVQGSTSRSTVSKKWDAEGRLLEHSEIQQYRPSGSAEWETRNSTVTSTTYFPLSSGERLYRENVIKTIKQHFSENLDAYERIMDGGFMPLDFYPERSVETSKGTFDVTYITECSIEKRNNLGLPSLILHSSVREKPNDLKEPRTTSTGKVSYYYNEY